MPLKLVKQQNSTVFYNIILYLHYQTVPNTSWFYENHSILSATFLGIYKDNSRCHMSLEGLRSVCAKLAPTSYKNNEILEINVLQKFILHAFFPHKNCPQNSNRVQFWFQSPERCIIKHLKSAKPYSIEFSGQNWRQISQTITKNTRLTARILYFSLRGLISVIKNSLEYSFVFFKCLIVTILQCHARVLRLSTLTFLRLIASLATGNSS